MDILVELLFTTGNKERNKEKPMNRQPLLPVTL